MIRRWIGVFAAIQFLAACAAETPSPQWSKPGADAEDLSAARAECVRQAQEPDLGVERSRMQAEARGNIFLRCMREKGWEQVPGEPN